ncbi:Lrp/AsnC ligand binding domain-containing protein [Stappia sp. ES.058]|uniref:Lrp/AsnC ligand binding domain-containing protein n=1 Tax=Stappia sp. ES.058 TaxID=1881061 RepID=UPI00087CE37A|nr:Lrp/AsnC ligand binding domain-containing protein [Stappia sp. ES.058]SDT89999.1 transcriptional regulator, AsnC family [Stappia sp. ES.058]
MTRNLDAIDRKILDELQRDGRLSIVELADRVGLTKTPCAQRVRRLERSGVISGYSAKLDPVEVNMNHVTIVQVNMMQTVDTSLEDFNEAVKRIPEIQTCMMIAGSFDYLLQVRTRDIAHFRALLGDKISKLPNVMQTHSFAVLETVKDSDVIAMQQEGRRG